MNFNFYAGILEETETKIVTFNDIKGIENQIDLAKTLNNITHKKSIFDIFKRKEANKSLRNIFFNKKINDDNLSEVLNSFNNHLTILNNLIDFISDRKFKIQINSEIIEETIIKLSQMLKNYFDYIDTPHD